jgi:hypothetical protein
MSFHRVLILLFFPFFMVGQSVEKNYNIVFQPTFLGKNIVLEEFNYNSNGDSLSIHTLRFYLGNFVFFNKGKQVLEDKKHYLLDLENEKSLNLAFQITKNKEFDSLRFELGVDSFTHVSGVMSGDLDPTLGMFWTWQSGYINVKLEGFYSKYAAKDHKFEFHLGGYLSPFQSVQSVGLHLKTFKKLSNLSINLDLTLFFEKIDWLKNQNVMSPSKEAVHFSQFLSKSFLFHAQ